MSSEAGNDLNSDSAFHADDELLVGQTIAGRYKLLSLLGRGGMGSVYKAMHADLNRMCAVKILHAHHGYTEKDIKRFRQEAKMLGSFQHKNIVGVTAFGVEQNILYFVMDFLEGKSLAALIKEKGRFEDDAAMPIFLQIAGGLSHAHKQGIIHRDMKPDNVILVEASDGTYTAKIVDFGIAKMLPGLGQETAGLTQDGSLLGSPLYMSPEQCQGKPLDARSDLYSLSCIMYQMLAGSVPFVGATPLETMGKHVQDMPPDFASICPGIFLPKGLERIVFKGLSKEPSDRWQDADELVAALEKMDLDSCEQVRQVPKKKRRVAAIAIGVCSMLLALGIVCYVSFQHKQILQLEKRPDFESEFAKQEGLTMNLTDGSWLRLSRAIERLRVQVFSNTDVYSIEQKQRYLVLYRDLCKRWLAVHEKQPNIPQEDIDEASLSYCDLEIILGEFERAIPLLKNLALKQDPDKIAVNRRAFEATNRLITAYQKTKRFDELLPYLDRLLSLSRIDNATLNSQLLWIVNEDFSQHQYREILAILKKPLKQAQEDHNKEAAVSCSLAIVDVQLSLNEIDNALATWQNVRRLIASEDIKMDSFTVWILLAVASPLWEVDNTAGKQAVQLVLKAVPKLAPEHRTSLVRQSLFLLAHDCLYYQRWDDAAKYIDELLAGHKTVKIDDDIPDKQRQALIYQEVDFINCLMTRALIAARQGSASLAHKYINDGQAVYEKNLKKYDKDGMLQLSLFSAQGQLGNLEKRYADAERFHELSLEIAERNKKSKQNFDTYQVSVIDLIQVLLVQNKTDEAERVLERCERLFTSKLDHAKLAACRATIYRHRGEFDRSIQTLLEAYEILQAQFPPFSNICRSYNDQIAGLLLAKSKAALMKKQYGDALKWSQESLARIDKMKSINTRLRIHVFYYMSAAYSGLGKQREVAKLKEQIRLLEKKQAS